MRSRIANAAIIGVLFFSISSVAQTNDTDKIREMNQRMAASLKAKDLVTAEKQGTELLDLSLKVYGSSAHETALVYLNLGLVQRQLRRFQTAIQSFTTAIEILVKLKNDKSGDLATVYEALAYTYALDHKFPQARANYLNAISAADRDFGSESKESYMPSLNLANLYLSDGKYVEANEYYVRSYDLAFKNFGPDSKEVEYTETTRICGGISANLTPEQEAKFYDVKKKYLKSSTGPLEVLNGKALKLPSAIYPPEAAAEHIGGRVLLAVVVDLDGSVTAVRFMCGNRMFESAAIDAAKKAKFAPSFVDGKPTTRYGLMFYDFVRTPRK